MTKRALFLLIFVGTLNCFGQYNDSLNTEVYQHNRKKAALLSTFIPGAGQIYNEFGYRKYAGKKNRSWWKVPIIYGGFAVCGYYYYQNKVLASLLKQEYIYRETQPVPDDSDLFFDKRFVDYNSTGALIDGYTDLNGNTVLGFDKYSKRRDFLLIGFIGIWGLNIIESYVDAHFVTYDVSEDLSLSWSPTVLYNNNPGVKLQLNFY